MICRCTYTLPIFFIPPVFNMLMSKVRLMPKAGLAKVLVETIGITIGLTIAMPLNCALFAQQSRIMVKDLEPEIQERIKDKNLTYLTFNKGL